MGSETKIVLRPNTCDTGSVSSKVANEKPRQNSDPKSVLELMPADLMGQIPRTGDPINRGPIPGYSASGTSIEDLGRPTELVNSSVV